MFTLEESQSLISWLAHICKEISPLRDNVRHLNIKIEDTEIHVRGNGGSTTNNKLVELNLELKTTLNEINEKLSVVEQKGIIIKGIDPGLFDFPYLFNEREVYLCWREGEVQIEYWHEINVGFAGRQKL